jgi:hypothetical protein
MNSKHHKYAKKKGGVKVHHSMCKLCDGRGGNAGRLMHGGGIYVGGSGSLGEESSGHEASESSAQEAAEGEPAGT